MAASHSRGGWGAGGAREGGREPCGDKHVREGRFAPGAGPISHRQGEATRRADLEQGFEPSRHLMVGEHGPAAYDRKPEVARARAVSALRKTSHGNPAP